MKKIYISLAHILYVFKRVLSNEGRVRIKTQNCFILRTMKQVNDCFVFISKLSNYDWLIILHHIKIRQLYFRIAFVENKNCSRINDDQSHAIVKILLAASNRHARHAFAFSKLRRHFVLVIARLHCEVRFLFN